MQFQVGADTGYHQAHAHTGAAAAAAAPVATQYAAAAPVADREYSSLLLHVH